MAQGTQLYNYGDPKDGSNKQPIYPITDGSVVTVTVPNVTKKNAQDCIKELYSKIAELTKDDETVNNIQIDIKYLNSNTMSETEMRQVDPEKWGTSFVLPKSEKPYAWKHTKIAVKGTTTESNTYELIAVAAQDQSQIIYAAFSDAEKPELKFIQKKDQSGNPEKDKDGNPVWDMDAMNDDSYLPGPYIENVSRWTYTPQSISAERPKLYMAVRFRDDDGKWGLFQGPYLYANWAYDSITVFKYKLTDLAETDPDCEIGSENPGSGWESSINNIDTSQSGKIWMISATYSGNKYIVSENRIWSNPTILSIIK